MNEARRALRAHWVAVAAAALSIFVTSVTLAAWRTFPPHPIRVLQIGAIVIAVATLLLLWTRRRSPSKTLALGAVLAVVAPMCAYYWFNDAVRAAQGACWVPFEGNKVAVLALALLAPPSLVVGLIAIGGFAASALVHYAIMPGALKSSMAAGEPWTMLAYAGVAVGIFLYRLRSSETEDEVHRAQAEAALLHEVALISLAVRDLANTPVQTLELLHGLLKEPGADIVAIERRMKNALDQLNELNGLLSKYETAAGRHGGAGSLDSVALLGQKVDPNAPP
jgi:hypothetical protein